MNGWTFRRPWWLTRRHATAAVPGGPDNQTITPAIAIATFVALTPAVSTGPVTVTPPVATATWTASTPAVQSTVTVTPSVATATWTASTPTVTTTVTLTPEVAVATWTVLTPAVQTGSATLTPPVAIAAWTASVPTATGGSVSLTPAVAVSTWTALAPEASAPTTLSIELVKRRRAAYGDREFEAEHQIIRARRRPYAVELNQTVTPTVAVASWQVPIPGVTSFGDALYARRHQPRVHEEADPLPVTERQRVWRPWTTATAQTLTPSVAVATWTAPTPTVTTTVTLTPAAAVSTWSTATPTVTATVTLSPAAAVSSWTALAPTVSAAGELTPAVAVSTWTALVPTVTGTVTVTPSVAVATWTAPTPGVSGAVTLTPLVASATWTALAPAVTTTVTLTPSVASSTWSVPTPAISGSVTLTPPAAVATWTALDPAISVEGGSQQLTPAVAVATWAALAPTVQAGAVTLTPAVASSTWHVSTPAVSDGTTPPEIGQPKGDGGRGKGHGRDKLSLVVGHRDLRSRTLTVVGKSGLQLRGTADVRFTSGDFDELPVVQPFESIVPEIPPPPVEQPRVEPTPPPAPAPPPEPKATLRHLPRTWRVHGTGSLPVPTGAASVTTWAVNRGDQVPLAAQPQEVVEQASVPSVDAAAQARLAAIQADDEEVLQLFFKLGIL